MNSDCNDCTLEIPDGYQLVDSDEQQEYCLIFDILYSFCIVLGVKCTYRNCPTVLHAISNADDHVWGTYFNQQNVMYLEHPEFLYPTIHELLHALTFESYYNEAELDYILQSLPSQFSIVHVSASTPLLPLSYHRLYSISTECIVQWTMIEIAKLMPSVQSSSVTKFVSLHGSPMGLQLTACTTDTTTPTEYGCLRIPDNFSDVPFGMLPPLKLTELRALLKSQPSAYSYESFTGILWFEDGERTRICAFESDTHYELVIEKLQTLIPWINDLIDPLE